jgi:hypothetical protein
MLKGLGTALIGSILVLATLGIALGASLGDADLFNSTTSGAQARSMDAQTQVDTARAQLEIEQRRAEADAKQAADALDLEHLAAVYEQGEKRGEVDLHDYEATLAEERAFLQRQYELQLQQQQYAFEQEMAMKEVRQIVLLGVGSAATLAVTIAVAYYLYASGRAKRSQVPRAERRHRVVTPKKEQRARQPASVVARQPIIPQDRRVASSYQDQPGGDGRGARVYLHDQG